MHVGPGASGEERIHFVSGRDGPANHGRLCVKGRYGFDYVHNTGRLTVPLIRRDGAAKDAADIERIGKRGEAELSELFRPARWDEALAAAAAGLKRIRDEGITAGKRGNDIPLAGFGSAKAATRRRTCSRSCAEGFRTNNVDHCTRLCHASSVAALLEGIGSGAVSNLVSDVAPAEFVLLIGANPVINYLRCGTWLKNAVDAGTTLVVADPRSNALVRRAKWHLRLQARHRRGAAQRPAARDHRRGPRRRRLRRCRAQRLRATEGIGRRSDPRTHGRDCGIDPDDASRGTCVCNLEGVDDPVGHGHQPACPRHRQRARLDRAGDGDRTDRPSRHRTASAARPEQRAGRQRCRLDSDDAAELPACRQRRGAREVRAAVGPGCVTAASRRDAGPDRRRDHACRERGTHSRHLRRGREPGDVRPRPEPRVLHSPGSNTSWCRTSSRPRRRCWPT